MKLYISPSVQENNKGVGAYGTEEYRMNQIADVVVRELSKHKNIELKRNQINFGANEIINASNNWNTDYHIAIHSNGANGTAQGCEIFHYVDGTENNSLKISRRIYAKIEPLTPSNDRGLKNGNHFFEVGSQIVAASSLIEVAFHDNWTDASFIIANIEQIGQAIVQGILDHLSIDRKLDVSLIQNVTETPVTVVEKVVYKDKIVEVIKYVDKEVEKIVYIDKPFETIKEIEKIVYQDKIVMREPTTSECIGIILKSIFKSKRV